MKRAFQDGVSGTRTRAYRTCCIRNAHRRVEQREMQVHIAESRRVGRPSVIGAPHVHRLQKNIF